MTLKLNPEILRCAYQFLVETSPFRTWNLPDGEDVTFKVVNDPSLYGWHEKKRGKHTIAISHRVVGHTHTLMGAMAHELIHLHQSNSGMPLSHGEAFQKLSAAVSKVHGFDPKAF